MAPAVPRKGHDVPENPGGRPGPTLAAKRGVRTSNLTFTFALLTLGASLASLAAGCEGSVTVNEQDPRCPANFPDGLGCSDQGLSCTYEAAGCDLVFECNGTTWGTPSSACTTACLEGKPGSACALLGETCGIGDECSYEEWQCSEDHTWSVTYDDGPDDDCGCDGSACPVAPPADGVACDPCQDSDYCMYFLQTTCGPKGAAVGCGPDGVWTTLLEQEPCDCTAYPTVEACEADPGCRYLSAGGCEAPTLDQSGCFPKNDCAADGPCPAGTTCTTVNANLCTLDPCIECAAVSLCL
jgi:hypothetical protein